MCQPLQRQRSVYLYLFVSLLLHAAHAGAQLSQTPAHGPQPKTSHLEIFNLNDFSRTDVVDIPGLVQSPNWGSGKNKSYLLVNKDGLLYQVDLASLPLGKFKTANPARPLSLVLTGALNHSNSNHGLSPDGKSLAYSHDDRAGKGLRDSTVSRIYVQPVSPGKTVLLTRSGLAYFHSWSPDSKRIAYSITTGGNTDIYSVAVSGGGEMRLTTAAGVDDGADYSPDGHFLYFNSFRSGIMKIWRMRSDGTGAIRLSREDGSDWFPHPSPDGRYVLYLSYVEDQGEDDPACKDVRLMLLDLSNGSTRALVRFTGGKGSIDVPSWSSDGQHFAFISYDCL